MGYTHYWEQAEKLDRDKWLKAVEDCKKVCTESGVKIQYEYDDPKAPLFGKSMIRFNGVDENGHETFLVKRAKERFLFCKTAYKDYDICVTACLVVLKHHFGDDFRVFSDGDNEGFDNAKKLVKSWLGYGDDFKVDKD
jgi:hypothetical protein